MNRIACIIVVLVAGCATEGQETDVSFDSSSKSSEAPLRGSAGYDAGVATPEVGGGIDSSQIVDASAALDARVALDGLPCMQQVVANGYASDKASCATWKLKLTEPYNSQLPTPYTSQTACVALIDCYVAHSTCTNWMMAPCDSCLGALPVSVQDWQPLIDIVSPFCSTFFVTP